MSHWTPQRQQIYDWIANTLQLPIFADAYRGAVDSLCTGSYGHVSFVCHAGRDIMNNMAREFSGGTAGRTDYQHHARQITSQWPQQPAAVTPITGTPVETISEQVPISREAYEAIGNLVRAHREGTQRTEDSAARFFCTFLDYADKDRVSPQKLAEWSSTREWFLRHVHLRKTPFPADVVTECQRRFLILESLLLTAADSVRERLVTFHEILRTTNQ